MEHPQAEIPIDYIESDKCQSCGNVVPLVRPGENPNKYSASHNSWCKDVTISFVKEPTVEGVASLGEVAKSSVSKRGFVQDDDSSGDDCEVLEGEKR